MKLKPTDIELADSLRGLLQGQVCIVGVGNRQRGDDGAGPRLIDARPLAARGFWLDAGVAPENYLEPIVKTNPDTVLIVDAVAFGEVPGACRLMDATQLHTLALSTHAGSLSMLAEYLTNRTGAGVYVLAIQPEAIEPGETLSSPVDKSVRKLSAMLSHILVSQAEGTELH